MTPQEHLFMMTLYGRQNAKFNVLVEILKTRGVLEPDDLEAFRQAVLEDQKQVHDWMQQALRAYQSTAAGLGITTGLEDFQFPQK